MPYSKELIRDCQNYAKSKLNKTISEETAEQYLDSYADLWDLLADRVKTMNSQEKAG
jgi:hypothetical protein